MEAKKIFTDILHYIESSRLNFSLLRTPFSATISLKKSFVNNKQNESDDNLTSRCNLVEKVKELSAENTEMKNQGP